MKTHFVFLVALCVVWTTLANSVHQPNTDYDDQRLFEWEQRKTEGNQQGSTNMQTQQGQRMDHQNHGTNHGSMGTEQLSTNEWTDVTPYRTKITQRLENSMQLTNHQEMKEKLRKLMEDKMQTCRSQSQGMNKFQRHCMGRITGQMMQLIAAFENGLRDMPTSNDWNEETLNML